MSAEALTESVVALIRDIEVLKKEYRSTKCAEAWSESAVALIREYQRLYVSAHVIEVPCHSISGLRHSYNYMCSLNYYLIIGALCLSSSNSPKWQGTV